MFPGLGPEVPGPRPLTQYLFPPMSFVRNNLHSVYERLSKSYYYITLGGETAYLFHPAFRHELTCLCATAKQQLEFFL